SATILAGLTGSGRGGDDGHHARGYDANPNQERKPVLRAMRRRFFDGLARHDRHGNPRLRGEERIIDKGFATINPIPQLAPLSICPSRRGSSRSRSFDTAMISAQSLSETRLDNSCRKRASCSSAVNGSPALPFGAGTNFMSSRPSRRRTLTLAAVESALLAASTSSSSAIVVRSSIS